MIFENTEIKISLTIREAQSLATILNRANLAILKNAMQADLTGVPQGSLNDSVVMEQDLRNLLEWRGIKS